MIEAVVERLVTLLDVSACDIHVLEPGADAVRTVVSYDRERFDFGDVIGRLWPLTDYPATGRVVETGRPVAIMSLDDPLLNDNERRLLRAQRQDQPARGAAQGARPRDRRGRALRRQALARVLADDVELVEAICQFAALALDNAHLYESQRDTAERLERLASQLATLQQVSLKIAHLRDESSVVREVLESGAELLDADVGGVRGARRRGRRGQGVPRPPRLLGARRHGGRERRRGAARRAARDRRHRDRRRRRPAGARPITPSSTGGR